MKRNLTWKVFSYFFGFTIIILLILWVFQVVFIEDFYSHIRANEIKHQSSVMILDIADQSDYSVLNNYAKNYDICIDIISNDGSTEFHSNNIECLFPPTSSEIGKRMFEHALKKGSFTEYISDELMIKTRVSYRDSEQSVPKEIIMQGTMFKTTNGESKLLLVHSIITPLTSTISTIKTEFYYIASIMIVLAFIIAFIVSRYISKPIELINLRAKQLGKGNYEEPFVGGNYQEVIELAETLNQAANELAKVDQMQKDLVANISHDLKTPIMLISGYAEMVADDPSFNLENHLEVIVSESKHLTQLVNDMIDISEWQQLGMPLTSESINLSQCIEKVVKDVQVLIQDQGYQIELYSKQDLYVLGDLRRLSQVIYNLLGNALTYTGLSKMVEVRVVDFDAHVIVSFVEIGSMSNQDNSFNRYYQSEKHKRPVIGTGIGLSLAKQVIEKHDGECGVDTLEEGTVFWFKLPTIKQQN